MLDPGELLQLEKVFVNYVYDGDTIRTAEGKVIIRFIGIDTLEMIIFKYILNSFDYNPLEFLLGKEVKVTGKVVEYEGIPEIIIYSSLQIFILGNKSLSSIKE